MFIHDVPRRLLHNSKIYLHPTLRSPLGIASGAKLNVSVRTRGTWGGPELTITPYDYGIWPDIWNLNLHLIDKPGQLERLFKILEECSISVLHYAARTSYKSRYHSKYLVLDCSAYDNSEIDKRPAERHRNPDSALWGLFYNVLIEFMHEIRINFDNTPRIYLYRNVIHLNMWQDTLHKNYDGVTNILEMPTKLTCHEDGIELPSDMLAKLNIKKDSYCVVSAHANYHVLYYAILNAENAQLVHFVIYFNKEAIQLSSIMKILYDLNLNLVRSQLASGVLGSPKNLPPALRSCAKIATLNVMAIAPVPVRREELISKLNADSFSERARDGALYVELVSPFHRNSFHRKKKGWNVW